MFLLLLRNLKWAINNDNVLLLDIDSLLNKYHYKQKETKSIN